MSIPPYGEPVAPQVYQVCFHFLLEQSVERAIELRLASSVPKTRNASKLIPANHGIIPVG